MGIYVLTVIIFTEIILFYFTFNWSRIHWQIQHKRKKEPGKVKSAEDAVFVDLDADGAVDARDLTILLTNWGQ